MVTVSCTYEVLTNCCCPQVRHPALNFWPSNGKEDTPWKREEDWSVGLLGCFNLGERCSGVAWGWSRASGSVGVIGAGSGTGLVLCGVGTSRFGEGGASGHQWPGGEHPVGSSPFLSRREHPVGSSPLQRRGLLYIYIFVYIF